MKYKARLCVPISAILMLEVSDPNGFKGEKKMIYPTQYQRVVTSDGLALFLGPEEWSFPGNQKWWVYFEISKIQRFYAHDNIQWTPL